MTFEVDIYLSRLGLGALSTTEEDLHMLQTRQMQAIAFENIAPLLGTVPDLTPGAVWQKLVLEGQGGYCMEQNTLLGAALTAFGFEHRPILARVRMGGPSGGPRSHLAFVVRLRGTGWLVDAGFGGPGPRAPLKIETGTEQTLLRETFRFRDDMAAGEIVLERKTPEGWFPLFGFDDMLPVQSDIEMSNFYCARSPQSPFPSNLMMARTTGSGRVSLFNRTLRQENSFGVTTKELEDATALHRALSGSFLLSYGLETAEAIWARLPLESSQAA
ncbi:arylamine N-acetyltransferase family protein [Roseibium litorale]|uniref:Arylamine N-acetyltransferase n=1 Tax=Roseibium litorale TaxID=2803841 RepID=A0ABR9CIE5_9HYPH|nr:arylamine N-acetyltransferase [Roseibium litorale]MBD8890508.1 arylamine N-acetyltransferase [Roseibium litorale]